MVELRAQETLGLPTTILDNTRHVTQLFAIELANVQFTIEIQVQESFEQHKRYCTPAHVK